MGSGGRPARIWGWVQVNANLGKGIRQRLCTALTRMTWVSGLSLSLNLHVHASLPRLAQIRKHKGSPFTRSQTVENELKPKIALRQRLIPRGCKPPRCDLPGHRMYEDAGWKFRRGYQTGSFTQSRTERDISMVPPRPGLPSSLSTSESVDMVAQEQGMWRWDQHPKVICIRDINNA